MSSADPISEAIRALRKDCSMTQVEFAAALGVAPASIHRWESGTSSPEFEMIVSLWSFAIERGSLSSKFFAEFLSSRTEAIKPLFDAAQLPAIKAVDSEVGSLAVDKRQLVLAYIRMLKQNTDQTADRVMRLLLEPWTQQPSSDSKDSKPRAKKRDKPQ
ncbi:MAG TPA: helix-turn-helix transcriptional regulator [Bryobacteraceae bacterium]|nr:helix-turn-helix transcriptional regulator [Bryobacteraceae bacterium]HTF69497.1 helix-turn-helix transcriptional regulator [Edaphobacter sp.]